MLNRFRELSRFVADEARAGDSGLAISSQTIRAFQEMVEMYEASTHDWVSQADPVNVDRYMNRLEFVHDFARTIYMIRAINRLILLKGDATWIPQFLLKKINVVEAGCGSGFLAGVVLALSERTTLQAFDYHATSLEVTQMWLQFLGVLERAKLVQRDLLKTVCGDVSVDILVAEHISLGLADEHCTAIPRNFDVDPQFVVPYGVVPCINFNLYVPDAPTLTGRPLILADKQDVSDFYVTGDVMVPANFTLPVSVGNDIAWGAPLRKHRPLFQKADPVHLNLPFPHNHLTRVRNLFIGDEDTVVALQNASHNPELTRCTIKYPLGMGRCTNIEASSNNPKIPLKRLRKMPGGNMTVLDY